MGLSSLTPFPAGPVLKLQSPSPGCPGPLWTGGDVVGSPFPPLPVPSASPWASTHQHRRVPKFCFGESWGAQTGGVSIHLWPPHPILCPAWHSTAHTLRYPWSPEAPGQLILNPCLISCLYFLRSCQCLRCLNSHVCPGHRRLPVKRPSQGSYLGPVDDVFDRGAIWIVGCVHIQPCLQGNRSQLSLLSSGWEWSGSCQVFPRAATAESRSLKSWTRFRNIIFIKKTIAVRQLWEMSDGDEG